MSLHFLMIAASYVRYVGTNILLKFQPSISYQRRRQDAATGGAPWRHKSFPVGHQHFLGTDYPPMRTNRYSIVHIYIYIHILCYFITLTVILLHLNIGVHY